MQETINIESIWTNIYGKLFGFISKHAINKDDVNDIIQDTLIARNTMNDFFREKKKLFEAEENTKEVFVEPNAFAEEDIKIKIQTQEFSEYAGFIVSELPEKYQKAVYMADIEGLSMKEVAEELNISVSGAKSRVQRGRKMIKEIILKCCEVNTDKYGNIVDYEPHNCNNEKKC